MENRALPLADAATIVRAHQKDVYFEGSLLSQLQEALHILKGSRFVNTHPEEIGVAAKALYLALTTLFGARTLGEEYVDLIYVNRKGTRMPNLTQKLGFILGYALIPYLLTKLVRRLKPSNQDGNEEEEPKSYIVNFLASYPKVMDTIMNLHVALFYFHGQYYSISKRIFGLRYAFGHNKDPEKLKNSANNYSFLGLLIFLQYSVKGLLQLKQRKNDKLANELKGKEKNELKDSNEVNKFSSFTQLKEIEPIEVDLSDSHTLAYIPSESRSCMLCLSPMVNPSAALCGHLFCWECIVDWVRENPECPLCRQGFFEKDLITLK